MFPATFMWDIRPVIFHLGPLPIRYYSLLFALTFLSGFFIVRWMYRQEGRAEEDVDRLLTFTIIGTVVGARLGHCLLYDPTFYLSNPIEILKVWKGGLASHGGAIGIFTAIYLYTRGRSDQPYLWVLDRVAVVTALGGIFIRLGNFFNSEILGEPSEVPWAIAFLRYDDTPRHPAQLYESLTYALMFVILFTVYRKLRSATPQGLLLGLFLALGFTGRFFIEFVKMRQAAYGHDNPLSVGQWLSLPVIILGVILLVRGLRSRLEA